MLRCDHNARAVPNGYAGFNWSTYFYSAQVPYDPNSGYDRVNRPGGSGIAFSAWANFPISFGRATPFTFNSVWIAPAWDMGETITVKGFFGASELYTASFVADWTTPVFFAPNWSGVTDVSFAGSGNHLALDDITVNGQNVVPEPATMLLLATGLAGIGGAIRRRRQKI